MPKLTAQPYVRRRDFIKVIGGSAVSWPLVASADTAGKIYRLGILQLGKPPQPLVDVLRDRLKDLGYREGRNIAYEYRWAEGKNDRLDELAKELVDLKVDVITTLSTPAVIAAKKATKTIPIIFAGVGDPVGAGVVPNLSHPGGNVTGVSLLATELSGKRLEILKEIVPNAAPVAMFWNDTNPGMVLRAREASLSHRRLVGLDSIVGASSALDGRVSLNKGILGCRDRTRSNVRYWHLADMAFCTAHVRF